MNLFEKLLKKTAWLFIPMLLTLASCSESKTNLTQYGDVFNAVMLNDIGVFRGANIGDSKEAIKELENDDPVEQDSVNLNYKYSVDSTINFNISYNFDENGLKEIQTEIYVIRYYHNVG